MNASGSAVDHPIHDEVIRHWPRAQSHWSRFLLLSDPAGCADLPSIAQIHLGSRQVLLNYPLIAERNLGDCIEALLAHEIGHHVRYPGTLAVEARLRLLEKSLIPIDGYSFTNVFADLMINEFLGHALRPQFVKLYQALGPGSDWKRDPAFVFYLAIYEELWSLPPGTLQQEAAAEFARLYPGFRADARMLAEKVFNMEPNIYAQFLYFISVLSRYLKSPELGTPESRNSTCCHADEPTPEDWADALRPNGRERAAVGRGLAEGWLSKEDAEKLTGKDVLGRRIAGLPGMQRGQANQVPEIMAAYYRREAEPYLFAPPPARMLGDAIVPTTVEAWEAGDSAREIDWLQTLLRGGLELGVAQPLKRLPIAEVEGYDLPMWRPMMEVYLDVSGSMPDPRTALNAMTLAGLILVTAAIRKGGVARVCLYSSDKVTYWEWCRSELELSKFLMHYIGAGTEFPFPLLAESVKECGDKTPIRVVITDGDFNANFDKDPNASSLLRHAAIASRPFVLLLRSTDMDHTQIYRELGMTVVTIADLEDFPRMASQVVTALFPHRDAPTDR